MKITCNYIKYKFTFTDTTKHSSYLYQKIFRSIYGYQQNVTKKNKKVYTYYRKGVVSELPYISPGKNSIILPLGLEKELLNYFETGENPAHKWRSKGDWKVSYTIDKIDINMNDVLMSLEDYIDNYKVLDLDGNFKSINEELNYILNHNLNSESHNIQILDKVEKIVNLEWFTKTKSHSSKLSNFYSNYLLLKGKIK